jgi:hypothetical protein
MWRKAQPPSAVLFAGTQQVAEEWAEWRYMRDAWAQPQLKPGECSDGAQSVLRRVAQNLRRLLPAHPPVCRSLSMQPDLALQVVRLLSQLQAPRMQAVRTLTANQCVQSS